MTAVVQFAVDIMNAESKGRDPRPETFESIEAAADFWDNHDLRLLGSN